MIELAYLKNNTKKRQYYIAEYIVVVIIILQNGFISRNLIFIFIEV